jgi:hypothetical protein
MAASAWADYLDARLRLVHEWMDQGRTAIACAVRFEVSAVDVEKARLIPTEPPMPGSSRHLAAIWADRCARLERIIAQSEGEPTPRLPAPAHSEVRGLLPHEDPLRCGCQHWTDPPPAGAHHPQCVHGGKA